MLRSLFQRVLYDTSGHETFTHLFTNIFDKEAAIPDQLRLHFIGSFITEFSKALGILKNNNITISNFGIKVAYIQSELLKTSEACCNFIKLRIREEIINRLDQLFQKSLLVEEKESEENEAFYYTGIQEEDSWSEEAEDVKTLESKESDLKRKSAGNDGSDEASFIKKKKPNEESLD